MADLPGLIEGASAGLGLGHKFLRHAMRTRVIVHVLDMGSSEGRNPIEDYETIRQELENYSIKLANKKEIIVANKKDLPLFEENLDLFKKKYPDKEIFAISAELNDGIEPLLINIANTLDEIKDVDIYDENDYESHVTYKFENTAPFTITREGDIWIVSGKEIEQLFKMTKFTEDEAVVRFGRKLKGMGVEEELERLGAKRGDEVQILDYIFEFKE